MSTIEVEASELSTLRRNDGILRRVVEQEPGVAQQYDLRWVDRADCRGAWPEVELSFREETVPVCLCGSRTPESRFRYNVLLGGDQWLARDEIDWDATIEFLDRYSAFSSIQPGTREKYSEQQKAEGAKEYARIQSVFTRLQGEHKKQFARKVELEAQSAQGNAEAKKALAELDDILVLGQPESGESATSPRIRASGQLT